MADRQKKSRTGLKAFFTESPVKWFDWLLLLGFMGFCFLAYEMRDLFHTAGCSYGFLDGHFGDFYDYLAESGIDEDGGVGLHASYMPTVYLLFALWNLPMKLLGFVPKATAQLGFIPIMWAKILPCLAYLVSGLVVCQIAGELGLHGRKAKLLTYAALSSPVCLYGQFILGQYESFLMLCILAGFLFWLRRKNALFLLCFALGVTFKYTALLFFLPLLLLREKRIFPILLSVLGVLSVFALEFLLYRHSPTFMAYAFGVGSQGDNPTGYINNAAYFTGFQLGEDLKSMVYLAYVAFAFVVAAAYFKTPEDSRKEGQYAVYFLGLAGAALFCFSKWHPHWLMVVMPFFTISAFLHKNTRIFMALDLLFMVLFVLFCTGSFVHVTDEILLNSGIFKYLLPEGGVGTYATMAEYICRLDSSTLLSLLTAMLGVFALFKHPKYMTGDPNSAADGSLGWIRGRYILGLLVFIVPSMLCLYQTVHPPVTAYQEENRAVFLPMKEGDTCIQSFTAKGSEIRKLKFPVSVGEHSTGDLLTVRLLSSGNEVLFTGTLDLSGCYEGELVSMQVPAVLTEGSIYRVEYELTEAADNSTFCLLAAPASEGFEPAVFAGEVKEYHLTMSVYQ